VFKLQQCTGSIRLANKHLKYAAINIAIKVTDVVHKHLSCK